MELTKEQKALSAKNNRKAWIYFGYSTDKSHKGLCLHHKDESLMHTNIDRYIKWLPEDLEVMTKSEHSRHHKIGSKNPNFGKVYTEEEILRLSNIKKGKKFSEETKRKMSDAMKGENNPNFGKVARNKGIPHTEETKQKMRDAWVKRKANRVVME